MSEYPFTTELDNQVEAVRSCVGSLNVRTWGVPNEQVTIGKISISSTGWSARVLAGDRSFRVVHEPWDDARLKIAQTLRLSDLSLADTELVWHDPESSVAVYTWVAGQPVFPFDKAPGQPMTAASRKALAIRLARWHSHTSERFTVMEPEPAIWKSRRIGPAWSASAEYEQFILASLEQNATKALRLAEFVNVVPRTRLRELDSLLKWGVESLLARMDLLAAIPSFSLLHGDLHQENILLDGDQVRFIDYEDVHYGDRAMDVAFLLENLRQGPLLSDAEEESLLAVYVEELHALVGAQIDPKIPSRINLYRVYVALKFAAVTAAGFSTGSPNKINWSLLDFAMTRAGSLLSSLD